MRHVRHSLRCVRDKIYLATADLIGLGLSPSEALAGVEIVANRCFGRSFHRSSVPQDMKEDEYEHLEPVDQDTLPNERSVRDMTERIEDPPKDPADLYKEVDLHLTDSVSHNKFIGEDVPKLFDLDTKPGQIFCATHTGLGFCSSMNSSIHHIEDKLGIKNIMDGFVVEIEYESKNGSIIVQFVDCMTRLVGMELKHKPWNRGMEFKKYCNEQVCSYKMFLYKDERFGCFPKACAVCLYSRDILQDFLLGHPEIDNRLACLVRDIYSQEYVKLVLTVVSVFGVQLVEPFHAKTVSKNSNHNSLKQIFQGLYDQMGKPITPSLFDLSSAWYPGISNNMFDSVKESYGEEVIEVVSQVAKDHIEDAIKLANFIQTGLQIILGRQS